MADKQHILLVDDDPNISHLVRLYLEKEGFGVTECDRGDTAVEAFRTCNPALVLLDVMLPGKDGLEVLKEIRMTSKVPVIMLTAKDETFDKVLGLELGADDYITKPFENKELVATIKEMFPTAVVGDPTKPVYIIGTAQIEQPISDSNMKRYAQEMLNRPVELNLPDDVEDDEYDDGSELTAAVTTVTINNQVYLVGLFSYQMCTPTNEG